MPQPSALSALSEAWTAVIAGTAGQRPRDLAHSLGYPEAQLLAVGGADRGVHRLMPRWSDLIHALPLVGPVMVLTRNAHAVHEKTGTFGNIRQMGDAMLVMNEAIDLRLFPTTWGHAFDVSVPAPGGERRSIQIFDIHGSAVMKIYQRTQTDAEAFDALCRRFRLPLTAPMLLDLEPPPERAPVRPDSVIDLTALRQGWRNLTDVHHFRRLLRDTGTDRLQALRLAGPEHAEEVDCSALQRTLSLAADQGIGIMVFVGNRGCIQIHTGRVNRIVEMNGWINVLDPGFNLHVAPDATASAWVVRKPQADGAVTALELYDADGENFAILYGARQPGMPESAGWRAILETLPRSSAARGQAAE